MAELQLPNILGQYNQGYGNGQSMLANKLAGQAFNAPADQRQSLLGQLAGVNPQAAMGMQSRFQQQDQAQQAKQVDHAKKINGAANYVLQAVQSKDPARIQGAYQAVRPYLAELTGKEPPPQWDDSMLPGLYQTISATGGTPQQKGTVVAPGGALVDSATGQQMFSNPAAPANGQLVDIPDGQGGTVKMLFDPRTRQLSQPNFGGGQPAPAQGGFQTQITPASPANTGAAEQANALLAQGMQPQEVMQRLVQEHPDQQFQLAVDPATGQFKDVSNGSAQFPQDQPAPQQAPTRGLGYAPPKAASNIPSGYRSRADGSGLEPIPGGPADKSGVSAVSLGDPTRTGDSYLATIADPSMQAQIKAIAEGRMPLPKVSRPGKNGEISPQTIQQAVAQYDPTYDQADPTSRIKARNDFTSGKSAVQLRQLNTLLGHIGGLADAADKLGNTGYTYVNAAENAVGKTYNTKVSNFEAAARPAAEEFAALLKGGVPSVEEIKAAHEMLNPNRTPEQLHGVIGTMAAQIQSRIAALNAQAKNSLGPFASKVTIITPEGQAALDKLRNRGLIGKFDLGEEGSSTTQPSSQKASSQPRAVNSMGHAVVWNGSAWVPE